MRWPHPWSPQSLGSPFLSLWTSHCAGPRPALPPRTTRSHRFHTTTQTARGPGPPCRNQGTDLRPGWKGQAQGPLPGRADREGGELTQAEPSPRGRSREKTCISPRAPFPTLVKHLLGDGALAGAGVVHRGCGARRRDGTPALTLGGSLSLPVPQHPGPTTRAVEPPAH